jgi:hypothetical protein
VFVPFVLRRRRQGVLTEKISSIRAVTLTRRIVVGTRAGEICEIEKNGRIRIPIQGNDRDVCALGLFTRVFRSPSRSWRRRDVGRGGSSVETRNLYRQRRQNCSHLVVDRTTHVALRDVSESFAHVRILAERTTIGHRHQRWSRRCSRAVDVRRQCSLLTRLGHFMILNESNLEELVHVGHRNQEVSDIKFSPGEARRRRVHRRRRASRFVSFRSVRRLDDRYIAVGTHDNFVDIYSVETKKRT